MGILNVIPGVLNRSSLKAEEWKSQIVR